MIILWSILYILGYLIAFIVFLFILILFIGIVSLPKNKLNKEVKTSSFSIGFKVNAPFFLLSTVIGLVLPYFFLGKVLDYYPPFLTYNLEVVSLDRVDKRLIELNEKEEYIKNTISNIDNLTIKQISTELSKVLAYLAELKKETINQQAILEQLKLKRITEKYHTEILLKKTKEIEQLTQTQLDVIKYVITEDASEQNSQSFWLGILISFPMGVLTSIISNLLWKKLSRSNN